MNQSGSKHISFFIALILAGISIFGMRVSAAEGETVQNRPPVETNAIVDGEAKLSIGWPYGLQGLALEHGWILMGDATMKGYGTPMFAASLDKQLEVYGMEGAEVYVGANGILRFKWVETGGVEDEYGIDPYEVFFRTPEEGEEPKEFTLLSLHYDWDGELLETKELGTQLQGEKASLDAEMNPEIKAMGVQQYIDTQRVTFQDVDGDAVGKNESGKEVIRYPDTEADSIYFSTMSKDGSILAVAFDYPINRTEVFTMGSYDPSRVVYTDPATIKKVQEALNGAGFECGTADGVSGKKTVAAINAFRAENGLEENGLIDDELLEMLGI